MRLSESTSINQPSKLTKHFWGILFQHAVTQICADSCTVSAPLTGTFRVSMSPPGCCRFKDSDPDGSGKPGVYSTQVICPQPRLLLALLGFLNLMSHLLALMLRRLP